MPGKKPLGECWGWPGDKEAEMRRTGVLLLALAIGVLGGILPGAHATQLEGTGEIGSGVFVPTGADADVARISPVLQLAASVRFAPHVGAEAEFLYVPVRLDGDLFAAGGSQSSGQIVAAGGIRFTTDGVLSDRTAPVVYASLRAGFARIETKTSTFAPSGSWIGRTIDELTNPGMGFGGETVACGFVLSPKLGTMLRLGGRRSVDLALQTLFIFDQGDVATQLYLTASVALSAWQVF